MSEEETVHRVPGGLEFIINDDGSVTFITLPPEMIDVARALDPEATLACTIEASEESKD